MGTASPLRLLRLLLIVAAAGGVTPGPGITGALDGVSPPGAASSTVGWAVDAANTSAPVRLRYYYAFWRCCRRAAPRSVYTSICMPADCRSR
jgi:hypothetical protein